MAVTMTGNYTQLCSGGSTAPVTPAPANAAILVPPPVDAPVVQLSALVVPAILSGAAATFSGSFIYNGANVVTNATFFITVNGQPCSPGAGE